MTTITYYNLHDQKIAPPQGEGYYNLGTGRIIHRKQKDMVLHDNPRVAGTIEQLTQFFAKNSIVLPGEIKVDRRHKRNDSTMGVLSPRPIRDPMCELIKEMCLLSIDVGKSALRKMNTDVEKLSSEQIASLKVQSLNGMRMKGLMSNIIDGDTYDIVVYVPLKALSKEFHVGSTLFKNGIPINDKESGYFCKVRCRAFGIDAAEHDTKEGVKAIDVVKNKISELKNIVYCEFKGGDKYGRELVVLYEDSGYSRCINTYICNYRDPTLGSIAVGYSGGNKATAWRKTSN